MSVHIHPEVEAALSDGDAVVALESTIFSELGLPSPSNAEALERCLAAVRSEGAIPAVTCVLDGVPRVGLDPAEYERILLGNTKTAERDLPVAIAQRWPVGVTTVSASLALAAAAGIEVFATGGIGGVHRDDHLTGDVSADLGAIARHRVLTVCAGAKAFLDLAKTLELLDTLGVPVLGYQTDEFPAFYSPHSGLAVGHRIEDPATAAAVFRASRDLGTAGGVLVAVPIPAEAALPRDELDNAIAAALSDAATERITGAQLTPFVLARLSAATAGRSIPANLALAENNARVGGAIAWELLATAR